MDSKENSISGDREVTFKKSIDQMSRQSGSKHSKTSRSIHSEMAFKIIEKKAQSEAAKVAVEFVKREAELTRSQVLAEAELTRSQALAEAELTKSRALIEAEKTILEQQKRCAVLEAEVNILESECEPIQEDSSLSIEVPEEPASVRTQKYVEKLQNFKETPVETSTPLNPKSKPCLPHTPHAPPDTKYFLRKELLLNRLTQFDDIPEQYQMWKTSFKEVCKEADVNSTEELDLLLRWLGPKSVIHARNIRRAQRKSDVCLVLTWERLDIRYGNPEGMLVSFEQRLNSFQFSGRDDNSKLFELYDLLSEIQNAKSDPAYSTHLAYFDSPAGMNPIVAKLPYSLREKWHYRGFHYKQKKKVTFPPFSELVSYVDEISRLKNDQSFTLFNERPGSNEAGSKKPSTRYSEHVNVKMTVEMKCPIHNSEHSLNECKTFKSKPYQDRLDFMRQKGLCFKCCMPKHMAVDCKEASPECSDCGGNHATALHMTSEERSQRRLNEPASNNRVSTTCTEVCGSKSFSGKSCGKTLLVDVHQKDNPKQSIRLYAIIDDQSNSCLVTPKFFDVMGIENLNRIPYSLSTCAGITKTSGRRATGFQVTSITGDCTIDLPTLIECENIPNFRSEIATPDVAHHHKHLKDIAESIPQLDDSAEILMLIGRNMTDAFHVMEQRIGPKHSPYAQRLPLGWVVIGETCLGKQHVTDTVNVNVTFTTSKGRPTLLQPCSSSFTVKENFESQCDEVFKVTPDDEKQGSSTEDREFLHIMDTDMYKTESGCWSAPLPLRDPRPSLPNNKKQAEQRAKSLHNSLRRDENKKTQMFEFMDKIIRAGHCEIAPPIIDYQEVWYLPLFGVRHPRKPDQIRGVFDASAAYEGLSLNSVLLQGPDLVNRLLHVLLCFRKEPVAVMGDVEKMFYCFKVHPQYRDLLRFLWYCDNDIDKELIEYRMTVHVFGNKSSPAVATYGLQMMASAAAEEYGDDVETFIKKNFYVDDGLTSCVDTVSAIDLFKRTQSALQTHGNMRFHKIVSNDTEVLKAFPNEDRSKDLQNIELKDLGSAFSIQRSLGVSWNIQTDSFTIQAPEEKKPFTKRGVLSTIGSIYDPLGLVAPVTIDGKLLLRQLLKEKYGWDDPLPSEHYKEWISWILSLKKLETVSIPRTFVFSSFENATDKKLFIYCDASINAIAAVAYLKVMTDGQEQVGFVMGKVKIAPSHGHTIPRLELCSAVLATEIAETLCDSLGIPPADCHFRSDSKIVLGYLRNKTKKFKIYVSNRISRILKFSSASQWSYVASKENPADDGTRILNSSDLQESKWLKGPHTVSETVDVKISDDELEFDEVISQATHVETKKKLGTCRFARFSSWIHLVNAIAQLKHLARMKNGTLKETDLSTVEHIESHNLIISEVQKENFSREIQCLADGKPLPNDSPLLSLNPILDANGMLRIGGRLNKTKMCISEKNPLILPKKVHVSKLIIHHFHEKVSHQGRQFTEGAVRSAGYWILGGKRLISSLIHQCIKCRKLRGRSEHPLMADLPLDRVGESPPFTHVGIDTFGPWNVVSRKTRGGSANSKRWAIIFTCLVVRAVHIELVEEMTTSAFINALRRFMAMRGDVKVIRSDRGTNFIGCANELKSFLKENNIEWIFNPPYASHMGGAWERLIGVCRKILDSMLSSAACSNLTHDVLVTLMAEVCAIVNNRPLVPVSSDPENPSVLTPAAILTQKLQPLANFSNVVPGDMKNLYRVYWKRVQHLANEFWCRWRSEYLHTLQPRKKWSRESPNLKTGDVVLLKEDDTPRNSWPLGVVTEAKPSSDDRVRTVMVRTGGKVYTRPVVKLIPLIHV